MARAGGALDRLLAALEEILYAVLGQPLFLPGHRSCGLLVFNWAALCAPADQATGARQAASSATAPAWHPIQRTLSLRCGTSCKQRQENWGSRRSCWTYERSRTSRLHSLTRPHNVRTRSSSASTLSRRKIEALSRNWRRVTGCPQSTSRRSTSMPEG